MCGYWGSSIAWVLFFEVSGREAYKVASCVFKHAWFAKLILLLILIPDHNLKTLWNLPLPLLLLLSPPLHVFLWNHPFIIRLAEISPQLLYLFLCETCVFGKQLVQAHSQLFVDLAWGGNVLHANRANSVAALRSSSENPPWAWTRAAGGIGLLLEVDSFVKSDMRQLAGIVWKQIRHEIRHILYHHLLFIRNAPLLICFHSL